MIFFSFIPYERENKASHRIAYFRAPLQWILSPGTTGDCPAMDSLSAGAWITSLQWILSPSYLPKDGITSSLGIISKLLRQTINNK